jgi:aryl-alcohol dehydrogenase-like predicted oxidoreductase
VPIPGTKRRQYVEENALAGDIKLTAAMIRELDEAFSPEAVAGGRYAEEMMTRLGG